ncbi:MAG: hypothetical protein A2X77_02585 [Gammaproteobacteria bacterium GWE2_42_36]|nr:MAG: hypothetical protein A2X77_02585 [Gammaproteobacteria bacterium GWE2_42_36]
MCFSAPISFSTGAVLLSISFYTIHNSITKNKKYLLFASMPLFFGIQQIIEGLVWVSLRGNHLFFLKLTSLGFLFFALFFWPVFSPLSMYFIAEKEESTRRKLLLALLGFGVVIGAAMYLPIIMGINPFSTKTTCGSIHYDWVIPQLIKDIYRLMYLFITIAPFLIIPNIKIRIFAILLLASSIISNYFYLGRRVSVWCFFAAILSIFIAYILHRLPKRAAGIGPLH